jgi:hypothetical protein
MFRKIVTLKISHEKHMSQSIYIKQSRVSYAIYNSRTAGQIFMIFILLDLSPPRLAE